MINKKVLELIGHFLTLVIYSFILFKSAKSDCFSAFDSTITLFNIIVSIGITFYLWSMKE